ncbi:MAG: cupin domain-containing protein [Thermoanaerobaculia bacterium]|nr:cupin domain-containing protein [Thermoanaerobaculia bacterium]
MSPARRTALPAIALLLLIGMPPSAPARPGPEASASPCAAEPARRVVLEDDSWRMVEITYPPGSESGVHEHPWPRTVYVLEGGTLELIGEDGAVRTVAVSAGDAQARGPERHRVRNPGETAVRVLETEWKRGGPAG